MIFALYLLYAANVMLRLNDYLPGLRGAPIAEFGIPVLLVLWLLFEKKDFSCVTDLLIPMFFVAVVGGFAIAVWPSQAIEIAKPFIPWVVLYFLTANLVHTETRMNLVLGMFVVTALIIVLHSVQQSRSYDGVNDVTGMGWSGVHVLSGRVRYVGLMNDPNDLALCFATILPFVLQLTYSGVNIGLRAMGYLLCMPIIYGIFLTNSRGGMLSVGVLGALYTYRRWGAIRCAILCTVMAAAVFTFGPSRVREQSGSDEASTEGRIEAWHTGIQLLKQHPVFGIGKDEFTSHHIITAHNSFVLCFAETGMFGYVIWIGAGLFSMYGLYYALKQVDRRSRAYRQTAAIFDSLAAFYTAGFFLSRTYLMMLPILLGLAVARYKMTRDAIEEEAPEEDASQSARSTQRPALPDLSWNVLIDKAPMLMGAVVFSIGAIYLIVRFKT
ncbi:MAG TPA: O-antigen ligase family protein [Planctomycetota bacterium]|nr:O-antigen ligase family protein [Planctomycetota bacterium]